MNEHHTKLRFDEMRLLIENTRRQAYEKDGVKLEDIDDVLEWLEENDNGTIELEVIDLGEEDYMRNTYFKYDNY